MSFPCIPVIHTLTLQHRIQENESLSLRPHDGSPLLEREEKASAYLLHYYIKVGSINSIFYFLHKAAEPFNCLEQDNLA